MDAIHGALDSGADPRSLARQIVDYLRGLMLIQMGNGDQVEVTKDVKQTMSEHARAFSTQDVLRMMKAFNAAAVDTRGGWQPSLSLELAVAEVLEAPIDIPPAWKEAKPVKTKDVKVPEQKIEPEQKPAKSAESTVTAASKPKTEAPAIGLAEVAKAWRDIRSVIKPDHPGIEALLNSCKPLEVRGSELYLGFQSDTVRALMDIKEKLEVAQAAIKEVLDVELSIKCVVTNAKGQIPPNVNPDGMVATAIQNGGEIVDVQD
jgi:DNA polymerase III gamma/tau subunit